MAQPALDLKLPSRSIAPVAASNNASSWLVGTTSLRTSNEVLLVEYDGENDLKISAVYSHPMEVWDIDASPSDGHTLFGTVHSQGGKFGATLWKAQPLAVKVSPACELSSKHSTRVRQLRWNSHDSSQLFVVEDAQLQLWHIREASAEVTGGALAADSHNMACAAWDPNNSSCMCTGEGGQIQVWDVRQRRKEQLILGAHSLPIRHLDFAKQRQDILCSCGDDGRIRLWDLRVGRAAVPLQDLQAHNHWVWKACFNPAYDNMLVSCSSDNTVALWHLAASTPHLARSGTVAVTATAGSAATAAAAAAAGAKPGGAGVAAPASGGADGAGGAAAARSKPPASSRKGLPPTGRLQHYTGHQDSVYQVAWSAVEPFSYVSLSYDGRLVLHSVPNSFKYKMLI